MRLGLPIFVAVWRVSAERERQELVGCSLQLGAQKRFAPEYNERFGIHVNIRMVLIFPYILDTYESVRMKGNRCHESSIIRMIKP